MTVTARTDVDVPMLASQGTLDRAPVASAGGLDGPGAASAGEPASGRRLTILIPTRNEAGNVEPLLDRLERCVQTLDAEILFVDDSDDDTADRIAGAAARSSLAVRLHARRHGERHGGLGGAVRAGLELASGRWVCVMDGDLQHPPELIAELLAKVESSGADIAVASRLARGGSVGPLGPLRTLASRSFAVLARALFLDRLAAVTDPMTGFFLIRRDAVDTSSLEPDGFKILLEILVRSPELRIAEVPFRFGSRHAGRSKAGVREVLRLARKLVVLSLGSTRRLARFLLVGASGFVVNNVVMAALTERAGLYYMVSAVGATVVTTLWNFGFTDLWVFRDRDRSGGRGRRFGAFAVVSAGGLLARSPLLFLLTSIFGLHYLISNMLSIGVLTGFRYALAARWIWRPLPRGEKRRSGGVHRDDSSAGAEEPP